MHMCIHIYTLIIIMIDYYQDWDSRDVPEVEETWTFDP